MRCQSEHFSNSNSCEQVNQFNADEFQYEAPILPVIENHDNPVMKTISADTVVNVLKSNNNGNPYIIIDCRYDYEYNGGHIRGAINVKSPDILERLFISNRSLLYNTDYMNSIKEDFDNVINQL